MSPSKVIFGIYTQDKYRHMQILNLKRAYNINGSNILWNCSFTEGKIALRKWPEMLLLYWFSKFAGGEPPTPSPSFQSNTAQHKPLVQSEVHKLGSKQQEYFSID